MLKSEDFFESPQEILKLVLNFLGLPVSACPGVSTHLRSSAINATTDATGRR